MTIAKAQLIESVKEALVRRVRYAAPDEACGFIMNSADPDVIQFVKDVPNVSHNRRHYWRMDPTYQALAMANEDELFGVWHTHPRGPDGPSVTDLKYVPPGIRCFVATLNGVFEYEMESS